MSKLFLSEARINELLSLAEPYARDNCLFRLALCTGLRVSDLIKLRICQVVDTDGLPIRSLRVKMKKTKKYIERPLREDCRQAIAKYVAERQDRNPYLFRPDSHNSKASLHPISRQAAHGIYRKYLEKMYPWSVLQGTGCHVTRRSVAKIISDKAGRIEPATQFLGHRSIQTTMHYIDMDQYGQKADGIVQSLSW
jgi:integrase